MRAVEEALRWIVSVLERKDVPYQVVGGLAARAHGGTRPVRDLDFYVTREGLERIRPEIDPYVTRPPREHRGDDWWLTFAKLEFAGEQIELGVADDAKFRNSESGDWEPAAVRFDAGTSREVFGVSVRVMPRTDLISYKRKLDRDVDREDVKQLLRADEDDEGNASGV